MHSGVIGVMIRVIFFFILLFCKPVNKELVELENSVLNKKNSNEEIVLKISKTILKEQLKNFEYQEDLIYINFGSNMAYTFNSINKYSELVQFQVVRFILNFYYFAKKRNFKELRISYSKPFFSDHEGKETISEFEIFRVKIDLREISKIKDIEKLKFLDDEKKMNSNLKEIFNQVRLLWKVEMDETKRVELK